MVETALKIDDSAASTLRICTGSVVFDALRDDLQVERPHLPQHDPHRGRRPPGRAPAQYRLVLLALVGGPFPVENGGPVAR